MNNIISFEQKKRDLQNKNNPIATEYYSGEYVKYNVDLLPTTKSLIELIIAAAMSSGFFHDNDN